MVPREVKTQLIVQLDKDLTKSKGWGGGWLITPLPNKKA